jgi:FkbM family methyltransferase
VSAYNLAISDCSKLGAFYISEFTQGGADNNFDESLDYNKKPFDASFKQSTCSFSIDEFVSRFEQEVPDYLKIDVDGIEALIINGAMKTLSNPKLKGLLVEFNIELEEDMKTVSLIESLGFRLLRKHHEPMFDKTEYANIYNFIFERVS